jgi:KilA-N domain
MVKKIEVKGSQITVISKQGQDYISLTDMLKAKDGDFFISDWLRNRNTVEFLGIWETVYNPGFNYGEFAIINTIAITQMRSLVGMGLLKGVAPPKRLPGGGAHA